MSRSKKLVIKIDPKSKRYVSNSIDALNDLHDILQSLEYNVAGYLVIAWDDKKNMLSSLLEGAGIDGDTCVETVTKQIELLVNLPEDEEDDDEEED